MDKLRSVIGWIGKNYMGMAIVAMLAYAGVLNARVHNLKGQVSEARAEVLAAGVANENLRAELDTTRLVGDQYRRLAIQAEVSRDSIAEILNERPVVGSDIVVEAPPVVDTVFGTEVPGAIQTLRFEHEDRQLSMRVAVRGKQAIIQYQLKPIELNVGVRCGEGERANTAILTVEPSNPGYRTQVANARVDPSVCNPVPDVGGSSGHSVWSFLGGAAAALLVGSAFR